MQGADEPRRFYEMIVCLGSHLLCQLSYTASS
nr:MAG TPA: hypothetical protein [Caudoviricetes sp.]DAO51565.1 MAG TPA: hypothetical protein [Caudoviricetes sp.]